MKRILFIICIIFSINSIGQSLDTVYVRNLSLRAEEWYWLKGNWTPQTNSDKAVWKKIRNKLLADAPPANSTMVTVDSIRGSVALQFYSLFMQASKGETSFMTNNISNNIKAYQPMLLFTNRRDGEFQDRFQNVRQNGRDDFEN